jgi:hypothetical protein
MKALMVTNNINGPLRRFNNRVLLSCAALYIHVYNYHWRESHRYIHVHVLEFHLFIIWPVSKFCTFNTENCEEQLIKECSAVDVYMYFLRNTMHLWEIEIKNCEFGDMREKKNLNFTMAQYFLKKFKMIGTLRLCFAALRGLAQCSPAAF